MLDKKPISNLCDELDLQPTVFHPWQMEFFENGGVCLRAEGAPEPLRRARADYVPEEEAQTNDEVLAELMAEHAALKKEIGEL